MSKLNKYLSKAATQSLREHITEADGNEVFFVGHVGSDKVVSDVEVYTRGNQFSTPALLQVARQGDVVIHNHPSGELLPSSADTQIASLLGNDGIGFYIINNESTEIYVVVEPFTEKVVVPLNPDLLGEFLGEGGPVAALLNDYEYRPEQIEMVKAVSQAINEDKIAMIEAGTGTGKTLAYLLPAITYAINNKERIVVSTNTINLQEQLINKDLPFLQKALQKPFNAVLVKGRSNYACKRKLLEADMEPDLFSEGDDKSELETVLEWAKTSKDGSKSDLNFMPKYDVWEKVQSESDTSLKTRCPFYAECFFYTARKKAAIADILVANHHLLFSDLAVRAAIGVSENAILPSYDRIIFDEAHNIEEVATNYFGTRVTFVGLQRMLSRLYRKKRNKDSGLFVFLAHKLNKAAHALPYDDYIQMQQQLQDDGIAALQKLQESASAAVELIFEQTQTLASDQSGAKEIKLRLTSQIIEKPEWQQQVLPLMQKLVGDIRRFTSKMSKVVKKLGQLQYKMGPNTSSMTIDLQAQLDRLELVAIQIDHILLSTDDTHVRWIEIKEGFQKMKLVRLQSSPLDVANILQESVYNAFKNVTMTSATLTVAGRFDFLKSRIGLGDLTAERVLELQLPAPFNYREQSLVAIPTDIPEPNDRNFATVLTAKILEAILLSNGRAFVLFTSYGLLNKVYYQIKSDVEAAGINIYKQGTENRHKLLERFKTDVSSVLFATDSFWEGVDVHGEALESVIIAKLPFRVPSEPIIEARVEAIEARGGNAFAEYAIPQAAIKFRQGFGRLIRRRTDRGVVLVLDKRMITKSYGKIFLNSLPECEFAIGPSYEVFERMKLFYEGLSVVSE